MNRVVLMGRLVADPEIRYTQDNMAVGRYRLAVDRRGKDKTADFIGILTFGKSAEFAEKYLHKGTKVCVSGRIQTGSYTKNDGTKVYTTDVVVEEHEFAESRNTQNSGMNENNAVPSAQGPAKSDSFSAGLEGFMHIPDEIDEELPFN